MPDVMLIEGELDLERFEQAYRALVIGNRSATYILPHRWDGEPRQKVHADKNSDVQIEDFQADSDEAAINSSESLIRPFKLSEAHSFVQL